MNATLAIGSLAALGMMAFVIWMYRRGRSEGAIKQKEKGRKNVKKVVDKYIERAYNGTAGTDGFRVRKPGKWKPGS
jgi:hypothetical protein